MFLYTHMYITRKQLLNIYQHIAVLLLPSKLAMLFFVFFFLCFQQTLLSLWTFPLDMPSAQVVLPGYFCMGMSSAVLSLLLFQRPSLAKKARQSIASFYFNSLQKTRWQQQQYLLLLFVIFLPNFTLLLLGVRDHEICKRP